MLAAMVPRMDMDRLQQIPDLIAHFVEHQDTQGENKSVDFIDFINQHYGNSNAEPTDGHNLPFHGHDCNVISYLFASFISGLTGQVLYNPFSTAVTDTYTFHLTPQQLSDIWQPPRA